MLVILSLSLIMGVIFLSPNFLEAQTERKVFQTHSGAIIETSGQILDPVYSVSEVEFDPDEFLRNFEFGKISVNSEGKTIRDYTIIAEDNKIQEISPGIFYNVWTFNGTVPGPTIRATEGDIVRIQFINNGSKEHTIHFHGTHPAGMDGFFEAVGGNG